MYTHTLIYTYIYYMADTSKTHVNNTDIKCTLKISSFVSKFYIPHIHQVQVKKTTTTSLHGWLVGVLSPVNSQGLHQGCCAFRSFTQGANDVILYTTNYQQAKPVQIRHTCLLYTSPSPRDFCRSRMPSSA